jgi:Ca2+-binding RTX toxin-like protein
MAWIFGNDLKNDWLVGSSGADLIKGYGGNDTLKGGGGADRLDGGAGIDTALYIDSPTGVVVDLWTGRGWYGTADGDTLISIENLYGSAYRDLLFGTHGANELRGMDGDDQLVGYGGADLLDGGYGDDLLVGGSGGDILSGGAGFDFASYAASPAGVLVDLLLGGDHLGDAEGDQLSGIEGLYGSAFRDALNGDEGANHLFGYGGDDFLAGRGGDDGLIAGEGPDCLLGQDGNDQLYGETGDDWFEGGAGVDVMVGGSGADRFAWRSIAETGTTAATSDYVADFNYGEGDRLDLNWVDADPSLWGDQAFTFIGAAPFSGTPGEINYVHADGFTLIQLQVDADPGVDAMIRLSGTVTPEASWFYL